MGKTILIVDDAAFMRMMIKDILSKNGYEVLGEAQTGKEAIELYQKLKPD
ncbi:MAG: response regulator, partial [Candidatus Riflebacteria bacterium]|nr:response regulator [Candidatus Riflebacteria bacterium]